VIANREHPWHAGALQGEEHRFGKAAEIPDVNQIRLNPLQCIAERIVIASRRSTKLA